MKYLPIILLILFSCQATKIDYRNKTFRPAKVKSVKTKEPKLKKSKLAKQYRYNEISKREKKMKSYKNIQVAYGTCPGYNYESPTKHWIKLSKKLNPKYCNHIGSLKARKVMKSF